MRWLFPFSCGLSLLVPATVFALTIDFSSGSFSDRSPGMGADLYAQEDFTVEIEDVTHNTNLVSCPERWCFDNNYTTPAEATLITRDLGRPFSLSSLQVTENGNVGMTLSADGATLRFTGVGTVEFCSGFHDITVLRIDLPCSGQYNSCSATIDNVTIAVCGNGIVEAPEVCDDGNTSDGDECDAICGVPICGDGTTEGCEVCDDANTVDDDACSNNCIPNPICGDEIVTPPEECDDGNTVDGDGCEGDCSCGPCGDGAVCGEEECDDGNTVGGDGCHADCTLPPDVCGDGALGLDEDCDDGNTVDDDACSNDCTANPICGDGILTPPESCDDGNTVDDDACSNDCTANPICGDGILTPPESCDDGNTADGDGCGPNCTFVLPEDFGVQKEDIACVTAINKSWAGVIKATNKAATKCLKNISSDKIGGTFEECVAAADLGRVFEKTAKNDLKKCVGKIHPLMFGYIGNTTAVNMAASNETVGAHADLLGNAVSVVTKDLRERAKCQQEAQKGLAKYLDALAADANKAKKDCLKGKKVEQCLTSVALGEAMTATGKKSSKALRSWQSKVDKKCGDLESAQIGIDFPGVCSASPTYSELVTCGSERAKCKFCASLNAADGLAIDCATYSGDALDCGDPPEPNGCDQPGQSCGDGLVCGTEECDDGNTIDDDSCRADCTLPEVCSCGDGVVCGGETCDDGNTIDDDLCTNTCEFIDECGSGVVTGGEECDDGNTIDDDLCTNACLHNPTCGDGTVTPPELCDDGNTTSLDGCDSSCQLE